MQLQIRNKMFSIRGNSQVTDEAGQVVFLVRGKVFSFHRTKTITDPEGKVLYRVKNKVFTFFHKTFILDAEGNRVAMLYRKFAIRNRFVVTGTKDDIRINGDYLGWDYNIFVNDNFVGNIQKKIIALTDTYFLNIPEEQNAAFLVAAVIAIDNVQDDRQNTKN